MVFPMSGGSGLKPGRVKWVTFSELFWSSGQAQKSRFVILSNIAVTNNTNDCSIRDYLLILDYSTCNS